MSKPGAVSAVIALTLGFHRAINPDSIAKLAINQKLSPKWRQHNFGVNVKAIENYCPFQVFKLGSHGVINPDSIAKLAINQKLLPKWR